MRKVFGLLAITLPLFTFANTSEVTIPLSEYLNLIEKEKSQPITVVEEVLLKGDYKSSKFLISFKGQAVSPWKKTPVLANFEGNLRACTGSALVSYEEGNYQILPQKNSFQVSCALQPKNKNLRLAVLNALFFDSQVSNAESNINEDNTARRTITLLEKSKETELRPRADVVAKARYKLSVLPDISKFEYTFQINNPNRLSEKYSIQWINKEIVEGGILSTGGLKFEETASGLNVTLPPGDHNFSVRGKINGTSFKPLLKSEEQYLLIQNHPLMQVQPTTNWRRIATHESNIHQEYNSARAFLIDPRESLAWSAKKLDVYTALGYTLKNANYLYYVPRNGKAIVEATYQISNQGTPEIALQIPGKALYMSVDGQAFPLYKDDKGNLLISMTSGEHSVVVQYQPEMSERVLASVNKDTLAKPSAVITQSNMTLRYDPAWRLLAGRFGEDFNFNLNLKSFVWAFIYGALFFALLKKLYKIENKKILYAISAPAALLTLVSSFYTFMLFLTLVGLTLWRYRMWFLEQLKKAQNIQFTYKKIAVILAVFVVGTYFLSTIFSGFNRFQGIGYKSAMNHNRGYDTSNMVGSAYDQVRQEAAPAATMAESDEGSSLMSNVFKKGKALLGGGGAPTEVKDSSGDNYEGLPARIEIPASGTNEYFNLSLIDAEKEIKVTSVFIKNYFFALFDLLVFAMLAFALYKHRRVLKEALAKN